MLDNARSEVTAVEQLESGQPVSALKTSTVMRDDLLRRFQNRLSHNPALDRAVVSFQANKRTPLYGWFKYREGFSQQLVHYLLKTLMPHPGALLDPFAGAGAALFAARELGWEARGIELLPVGLRAIEARLTAERVDAAALGQIAKRLHHVDFAAHYDERYALRHIAITRGAFPEDEERKLVGFLAYCNEHVEDANVRDILLHAAFCVLEDISFTRKDGQYLRWDARSGRALGKKAFDKGHILPFRDAIEGKLRQMLADMTRRPTQRSLFDGDAEPMPPARPDLSIIEGSSLKLLPVIAAESIDFVLTSPPYANRYDYTRTYALELIFLGCGDEDVKRLRQEMLSCTVENRDKRTQLEAYYAQLGREGDFAHVDEVFSHQAALHEVLSALRAQRDAGQLNNPHIVRLVHNYFYEMAFILFELHRLLKSGGIVAMVNDNVRYGGEEVPVDLILSDLAERFGLSTRAIWTLGKGKGNSSQQMGNHGRAELRKCVYVWEKRRA